VDRMSKPLWIKDLTANQPAKKTAGRREWTRNGITAQHIFAFIGG